MRLRHLIASFVVTVSLGIISAYAIQPTVRVMSYNIRYDNPADSLDNWKYRRNFMVNMIRYHAPDIFGIQEGLIHQVRDMSALLPEYRWSGKGRDDGLEAGEFSAIFFRSDRFQVVAENTFWLSPSPNEPSRGWDAALRRIVSWVELSDQLSGDRFFVFNTHFDHQGRQAREESARLLIQKVRDITKDQPAVVMGDFNSSENDPPYRVITGAGLGKGLRLRDALSLSQSDHHGPLKTYSGFDVHQGIIGERIDFVLVSDGVSVLRHATLSDFMSNEHFPSDHLPVVADLVLP